MKLLVIGGSLGALLVLTGCGSTASTACVSSFNLNVGVSNPGTAGSSQTSGVADHTLAAPGNQQQFSAYAPEVVVSGQCAVPQVVAPVRPQWTVSDMMDVTISSANDATNGLATCVGTTLTPATVTATYAEGPTTKSASGTLTCK